MAAPARGSVVLVPFPFSDLSQAKLRPAVVLADVGRGDLVLCQVTSNSYGDPVAVELAYPDFASGSLHRASCSPPVGSLSFVKLARSRRRPSIVLPTQPSASCVGASRRRGRVLCCPTVDYSRRAACIVSRDSTRVPVGAPSYGELPALVSHASRSCCPVWLVAARRVQLPRDD